MAYLYGHTTNYFSHFLTFYVCYLTRLRAVADGGMLKSAGVAKQWSTFETDIQKVTEHYYYFTMLHPIISLTCEIH